MDDATHATATEGIYAFGDFRLEEGERRLLRSGEAVALTPKAFDVLLLLVRRAPRLVSRDEILAALWPGVHVTEGALQQKISALRRELGDSEEPYRFIETVTKGGYRFITPVEEIGPEAVARARSRRRALATAAAFAAVAVFGLVTANLMRAPSPGEAVSRDPEARREYLRARFFWSKRTPDDLARAAEAYESAVRRDPGFAAAWASLADTELLLAVNGASTADAARVAARKAVALDDGLGVAHGTLAFERFFFGWDFAEAGREFDRALALAPHDPTIRQRHAFYLAATGKADEAVAEIRRARDLDPASPSIARDVGQILLWLRRYGDAIEELRRAIEMEPGLAVGHGLLAEALLGAGRVDEARAEFARWGNATAPERLGFEVSTLMAAGRTEEAGRLLATIDGDARYVETHAEALAHLHAQVGDADGAMQYLERAETAHHFTLVFLGVIPAYDPIRSDPRFQALLRRVGIV